MTTLHCAIHLYSEKITSHHLCFSMYLFPKAWFLWMLYARIVSCAVGMSNDLWETFGQTHRRVQNSLTFFWRRWCERSHVSTRWSVKDKGGPSSGPARRAHTTNSVVPEHLSQLKATAGRENCCTPDKLLASRASWCVGQSRTRCRPDLVSERTYPCACGWRIWGASTARRQGLVCGLLTDGGGNNIEGAVAHDEPLVLRLHQLY